MMNKASIIAKQIEEDVGLGDMLRTHDFDTPLALGNYMYQQGYRFIVSEHRYVYDATLINQELALPLPVTEVNVRERLSETKLMNVLEKQVATMKELLAGAYPIKLTRSTKWELIDYCEQHDLSVDDFVEGAILEKVGDG